jgi:hypothetical protein
MTDRLREEKEVAELLERATELAESDGGVSARHCKDRVKSRFPAGHRENFSMTAEGERPSAGQGLTVTGRPREVLA